MLENVIKIAVDPLFPPLDVPPQKRQILPDPTDIRFELVFNADSEEGELVTKLLMSLDDYSGDIVEEEEIEDEEGGGDESEEWCGDY